MLLNSMEIKVEWGDCDPAGIVYYPNYFSWFSQGTHALFGAAGIPFHELIATYNIAGVPMLDTRATFKAPVRFGDVITLASSLEEWRNKSFVVDHEVYKAGELAAECREVRAWVVSDDAAPNGIRAMPIPEEVKSRFRSALRR